LDSKVRTIGNQNGDQWTAWSGPFESKMRTDGQENEGPLDSRIRRKKSGREINMRMWKARHSSGEKIEKLNFFKLENQMRRWNQGGKQGIAAVYPV
jgi:hypothetical protein